MHWRATVAGSRGSGDSAGRSCGSPSAGMSVSVAEMISECVSVIPSSLGALEVVLLHFDKCPTAASG